MVLLNMEVLKYLVQHFIPCDPGMICRVSIPSEGFARITHIHNSGSIFGLFSGNNIPLIFVSFVGVCVLLYWCIGMLLHVYWCIDVLVYR